MEQFKLDCGCKFEVSDDEMQYTFTCKMHYSNDCLDCNEDVFVMKEYFMIRNELWESIAVDEDIYGLLCLGCIENRLGRQLNSRDFAHCPLNQQVENKSMRLLRRMLTPSPDCSCNNCTA